MKPKHAPRDIAPDNQVRLEKPDERTASQQLPPSDADWAESGDAPTMIAERETATVHRWPEAVRWGTCLVLALSVHAAGAVALLVQWNNSSDLVANAPVIMIELAPVPVAPDVTPSQLPPGPQQADAQPETESPNEKIEIKPDLAKEAELPATPPPPIEKPQERSCGRSTPASPARPARPNNGPHVRQLRRRAQLRTIPTRSQTGNRHLLPGSNVTSAIRQKRNRVARTVLRSSRLVSIEAAACTMHI